MSLVEGGGHVRLLHAPAELDVVVGQTVFFVVTNGPGVSITDTALLGEKGRPGGSDHNKDDDDNDNDDDDKEQTKGHPKGHHKGRAARPATRS